MPLNFDDCLRFSISVPTATMRQPHDDFLLPNAVQWAHDQLALNEHVLVLILLEREDFVDRVIRLRGRGHAQRVGSAASIAHGRMRW